MANTIPITGSLVIDGTKFSLTIAGDGLPVPPDPIPPQPPVDTVVITPSGGDDTARIQDALNQLPAGDALMLSGMFSVGNTVWLDGVEKTLTGDPAKQSGMRPTRSGMSGPYGHMLSTTPNATRCKITALDLDAASKQVGLVFFDAGVDNSIEDCYLHDIAVNPQGAPYGAIHTQRVVGLRVLRNRVERTGGVKGGEGIRGIYVCGTSCWVEGNTVRDTGHTCIAVEGANVTVTGNTVERSLINGTGCKVCYRAPGSRSGRNRECEPVVYAAASHVFSGNTVRQTMGGGLMLQDLGDNFVVIENNTFVDCGAQGTTFGAIYNSNQANNVTFRSNRVENCRSLGGLLHVRNWTFTDTTFAGGSNLLHLENDCHNVRLTNSGKVNIGQNVTDVYVDGVKVA